MQGVGICGTSSPPPDYDAYRAYLAGEIVAFVQGILHLPTCREKLHLLLYLKIFIGIEGDCSMFDYLEEEAPTLAPVDVTAERKGQRGADGACGAGGCSYV